MFSGEKHIVIIVSPIEGGVVTQIGPVEGPAPGPMWGSRRTYMLTLFDARPRQHRAPWHIPIYIQVTIIIFYGCLSIGFGVADNESGIHFLNPRWRTEFYC